MIDQQLTRRANKRLEREKLFSVCPGGILETDILIPDQPASQPPLVALHGISRNAAEMVEAFSEVAELAGRIVIVPHFTAQNWPVYQRITRRARPDRALLAMLATLRTMAPELREPVDLFGFSGGAQLAHRFAMLYPERIGKLQLGAAGWYTLPDDSASYPYGLCSAEGTERPWSRRMRSGLGRFLEREITVYVGQNDTLREDSLRVNAALDAQQGPHRVARAQNYVACIRRQQEQRGLPVTARLVELPSCDHSFRTCATRGDLAARVCGLL